MLKIDRFNKPIQDPGIGTDNSSKAGDIKKDQASKADFNQYTENIKSQPGIYDYDKNELINVIKDAQSIEDAIMHISDDVIKQIFHKDSIFYDEEFINRIKQDLNDHFSNDPLAQEILHSLK